ncbi:thymidylate synthase [Desulfobacter sp.]|uniref:thymidylate synthase n=1 Tax=Desulfobacter sp. TaxID=2294 RepID=UPI000E9A5E17|nr:thymidylate synthase [Desulfobacter sp.]HBT89451.1 thymidylate synthase [Desulfobacter sp.]
MDAYSNIVKKVLNQGQIKENRTGVNTIAIAGAMFEHDMAEGFPLLTTKYVPFALVASELEFFIKGITDKNWLRERNNHIWDEWCSPAKVAYGHDKETRKKMMEERELGPIYGFQWRHFGGGYQAWDKAPLPSGVDQLKHLVATLKTNPDDRRMIVSAWNPMDIGQMALPPCHYGFQVTVINGRLNLLWNQRSVDTALGLPFNIASYGLLLTLLALESGFKPGTLVGFLGDTHIYENHVEGVMQQLERKPFTLPGIETTAFSSIFDWQYNDTILTDYRHHPAIRFEIAV